MFEGDKRAQPRTAQSPVNAASRALGSADRAAKGSRTPLLSERGPTGAREVRSSEAQGGRDRLGSP
eukprot:5744764-Alexandrium_andersonii.AAC.1